MALVHTNTQQYTSDMYQNITNQMIVNFTKYYCNILFLKLSTEGVAAGLRHPHESIIIKNMHTVYCRSLSKKHVVK